MTRVNFVDVIDIFPLVGYGRDPRTSAKTDTHGTPHTHTHTENIHPHGHVLLPERNLRCTYVCSTACCMRDETRRFLYARKPALLGEYICVISRVKMYTVYDVQGSPTTYVWKVICRNSEGRRRYLLYSIRTRRREAQSFSQPEKNTYLSDANKSPWRIQPISALSPSPTSLQLRNSRPSQPQPPNIQNPTPRFSPHKPRGATRYLEYNTNATLNSQISEWRNPPSPISQSRCPATGGEHWS